jgi:hypothetical protein
MVRKVVLWFRSMIKDLSSASHSTFAGVRFVLTDMDDTLTYRGRLSARTYDASERLQAGGVKVIPVTAAPAGWCDQMARMWPVDGVIGENGGLFIPTHRWWPWRYAQVLA